MRIFGIICEYNPFHRGHKWQIDELRRLAGEEECAVVCAMSGDFVQRGDFAIERAHARAEAAVRGGADLVLELPLPWAISSAEGFARGGGEHFGGDGRGRHAGLWQRMRVTRRNCSARQRHCCGRIFPTRCERSLPRACPLPRRGESAARALIGEDAAVLREPNDILGVEYCKALLQSGSTIAPLAILRKVVGHNGGCGEGLRLGEPHPRAAHERRGRLRVSDGGERCHLCARMRSGPRAGDDAECGASGAFPAARDVRGGLRPL